MENAAKALEIAAGVLISLMIIGLLVWGYNHLSELKKTQADVTAEEQATDFNKQYESYNKDGLYGSQIFSLANMVYDYNKNQSDKRGYTEMQLTVKLTKCDNSNQCFINGTYYENENDHTLTDTYNSLEKKIDDKSKETVDSTEKTYKELSSMNSKTLLEILGKDYSTILKPYTDLTSEQTDIARQKFTKPDISYDQNGRLTSMSFSQ